MTDDQSEIEVPSDFLLQVYLGELGRMTQRALTAEAQVAVLQAQVANQRQMLESQNAPTATPETA